MVASDAEQAPFLARSVKKLDAKKVAVVYEDKAVSQGLADAFAAAFTDGGGEVLLQEPVPEGATDFTNFLEAAVPTEPDMIFFGGEYELAAALRTQATEAGLDVPLVGGDGIKDDAFIAGAGDAAKGTLASSVGVPADRLKSARKFLAAYEKADFAEDPSNFGPYAYDAANVLISAITKTLKGQDAIPPDARADVVAAVQATRSKGATGKIRFDEFGDTRNVVFTLYRVSGKAGALEFVPIKP
jgi:branched-chain amino acid transport system substrate-binding protein